MSECAGGGPAVAGGVEAISNDTPGGVGGAGAGGAVLNPSPLDCGSCAHVTLLEYHTRPVLSLSTFTQQSTRLSPALRKQHGTAFSSSFDLLSRYIKPY